MMWSAHKGLADSCPMISESVPLFLDRMER